MTINLALIGAGGKMGCRITDNIKDLPAYRVSYVEVGEAGIANLHRRGQVTTSMKEAVPSAQAVVLAVPDRLIGSITRELVPLMQPGALLIGLDPAAAYAGVMPVRADIAYFVTHPCHPPLFNPDIEPEKRSDWFGGVHASQHIVCALHQGTEQDYVRGEGIAIDMFGNPTCPVLAAHRISVEQMAILEPALVETFAATLIQSIKEMRDEVVARGVPAPAADAFLMGHLRTILAIVFGEAGFPFSDGALLAIRKARDRIFLPDWKKNVFAAESIRASVAEITDSLNRPH